MKEQEKEAKEENKAEKETKDEQKTKEEKEKKSIFKLFYKNLSKIICYQITIIFLLTLLYCKYNNYSDTLIYFVFGTFISILFTALIVFIKSFNILSSLSFNKKNYSFFINFCKNYTNFSKEKICILAFLIGLFWHLLLPLIALYYVKYYIKDSIKTQNTYIKAFIIFIIYNLFNVYIIDSFKVYNKSLKITKTEFNIINTSIVLTFICLMYYFESIKNNIEYNN
tara:strand:+ start:1681 stop:2355 length:675 start_codon:yes stop_codon:yes gene_type:complete